MIGLLNTDRTTKNVRIINVEKWTKDVKRHFIEHDHERHIIVCEKTPPYVLGKCQVKHTNIPYAPSCNGMFSFFNFCILNKVW